MVDHTMTQTHSEHQRDEALEERNDGPTEQDDVVARILARAEQASARTTIFRQSAQALQRSDAEGQSDDGEQFDREERAALRRVAGLSTELEDVTEVEYRQLRLENVVLIGVYSAPISCVWRTLC